MAKDLVRDAIGAWQTFSDGFSLPEEQIRIQIANRFLAQIERMIRASEANLFEEMIYESVVYYGMKKSLKSWKNEVHQELERIFVLGDRWAEAIVGSAQNYNKLSAAFRIGFLRVKETDSSKKKDAEKSYDKEFGFKFAGFGFLIIKPIHVDICRIRMCK